MWVKFIFIFFIFIFHSILCKSIELTFRLTSPALPSPSTFSRARISQKNTIDESFQSQNQTQNKYPTIISQSSWDVAPKTPTTPPSNPMRTSLKFNKETSPVKHLNQISNNPTPNRSSYAHNHPVPFVRHHSIPCRTSNHERRLSRQLTISQQKNIYRFRWTYSSHYF